MGGRTPDGLMQTSPIIPIKKILEVNKLTACKVLQYAKVEKLIGSSSKFFVYSQMIVTNLLECVTGKLQYELLCNCYMHFSIIPGAIDRQLHQQERND